jgi:hypothetical protein
VEYCGEVAFWDLYKCAGGCDKHFAAKMHSGTAAQTRTRGMGKCRVNGSHLANLKRERIVQWYLRVWHQIMASQFWTNVFTLSNYFKHFHVLKVTRFAKLFCNIFYKIKICIFLLNLPKKEKHT